MIRFSRTHALCSRLSAAAAVGALAFMSAGAQADDPDAVDAITVSPATVNTVGHDSETLAPVEQVTKTATIKFDPVTLTTNSGVALLKDSVSEAAHTVCASIAYSIADYADDTCVQDAVQSAQAQVNDAIARAKRAANG